MVVFDDLVAEQDRLDAILGRLDEREWASPSAARGWTIADVVLHLAQTEEAVAASVAGADLALPSAGGATLDEVMDRLVRADQAAPAAVLRRWRAARMAALKALRAADPQRLLAWAAEPLKPATLATTRLAEHWAHGLDIAGPLSIAFPTSPGAAGAFCRVATQRLTPAQSGLIATGPHGATALSVLRTYAA